MWEKCKVKKSDMNSSLGIGIVVTFIKIIKYAASHPQTCKVKELNGKNVLTIGNIRTVSDALGVIKEICDL